MGVCRMSHLSKTSRTKKWTVDFVADKLPLLLVLWQQAVDARERRKKMCTVGALPRTILKRTLEELFKKYKGCANLYAEAQRANLNCIERTPSLNYQATGSRLQDGVLWDASKQDIHECPVCSHCCTMIVDNALTVSAYNQGARDTTTAKGGDGKFAAKSTRVGHYCFSLFCGGQPDGGNCPECIRRVKDSKRPSPAGPGECGFSCRVCSCRCQVAFNEVHWYHIANAISTTAKKKRAAGGEEKKPEEKGLAVVSRALATMLESSLVRESQTVNGRSDSELI